MDTETHHKLMPYATSNTDHIIHFENLNSNNLQPLVFSKKFYTWYAEPYSNPHPELGIIAQAMAAA